MKDWRKDAACKGMDPGIFMTRRGASAGDIELAKAVCALCPVCEECLQEGVDLDAQGVWGGLTRSERNKLGRERTSKGKTPNKNVYRVRTVECGEWAGPFLRSSDVRAEMQASSDWGSAGEGRGRVREAARRPVGGTGQIVVDGDWRPWFNPYIKAGRWRF